MIKYLVGSEINGFLFVSESSEKEYRRTGIFRCPLCGNNFKTRVDSIATGHTKSCGCKTGRGGKPTHFHTSRDGYRSHTYVSWQSMLARCYGNDPAKEEYRSKGIIVCERWHDFNHFLADMGERPKGKTIDRFPNKFGNYEPGNCRWATNKQQANNLTNNRMVTYKGVTKTLPEWCDELKLNYHRVICRLNRGISPEEAFNTKKQDSSMYGKRKTSFIVTYNGKDKSLKEWADQLKLPYEAIRLKIRNRGWVAAKAINHYRFPHLTGASNLINHTFGHIN